MSPTEQRKAAAAFAAEWQGRGYEKGESQSFWLALLSQVFGIARPEQFISFEQQVRLDHTSFIDAFIPSTKVMIEQKSLGRNLADAIRQSDGQLLSPFQQAKRYSAELPYSQRPRWIVTCNFAEFWVYDMEQPNGEPQRIALADLEKEYERLSFLIDAGNDHIQREMEVSVKAGQLVGLIYDQLLHQYLDPENPETLRSLNILCVRLVFCLYAEDAHLFGKHTAFHDYLAQYETRNMRRALIDLFAVLDTPVEERDPYMDPTLKSFPYVNGGLFSSATRITIPQFTDELRQLILARASDDFDWSEISPTIFGAVFESTLNPETRRSGGMHYTSIENIHKVIDPLFLDDLREEFNSIVGNASERCLQQVVGNASERCIQRTVSPAPQTLPATTLRRLEAFHTKIASLTFLDPACGSGNFLTESYVSLRRLENEVIALLSRGQAVIGDIASPVKVDIHQFYGIEINDFAVSVATTALWIAEQQMLQETERIASFSIEPLPLKAYHNIREGNALRTDWNEVIPPEKLNYIMGNPPFVGARFMGKEQKQDVIDIFGAKWQGVGDLDYVCCWYRKAVAMMRQNPSIRTALVSTNSICQGGSVTNLWKPLFTELGTHIDFARRTFRWDSEADIKAHVHCVIVGFSVAPNPKPKTIYISDSQSIQASNINGYLMDAPDVWIEKRLQPLSDVPTICLGGQPIDDGNLVLTLEEKDELLSHEPQAAPFVRPFMMGKDFIERKPRYCLWLKDANPALLRQCHRVVERVQKVREFRLASNRASTLKAAETPALFGAPFECSGNYIALPKVSSENRRYIPIDYLPPEIIPGDKLFCMQGASLYHFGVLMSNVHMAWMRAVCGRLKSDYSYSNTIVYNNFPWPKVADIVADASERQCNLTETKNSKQRSEALPTIAATAQAILDARAKYPDCSLADLYDEVAMPADLRRAHQDNDRAVMQAYGFPTKMSESDCVTRLFQLYNTLKAD